MIKAAKTLLIKGGFITFNHANIEGTAEYISAVKETWFLLLFDKRNLGHLKGDVDKKNPGSSYSFISIFIWTVLGI